MIYAQIKNGVVINAIVVDDDTPLELFSEGFDYFLRIDDINPTPGIGYLYDGNEFSTPPVKVPADI